MARYVTFDPGTEKWIRWGSMQAAKVDALRAKLGLPAMHRAFAPESGVLVWVSSTRAGTSVRITGGRGHRAWNTTGSIHVRGGAVDLSQVHYPANWSRTYGTFAYYPAPSPDYDTDITVVRGDATLTLTNVRELDNTHPWDTIGSPTYPQGHTFHARPIDTSPDGNYVVVLPTDGSQSLSKIAVVAKWIPPTTSVAGHFTQVDVPLPPDVAAVVSAGMPGNTIPGIASSATDVVDDVGMAGATQDGDDRYYRPNTTQYGQGFRWRVFVNPYTVDKVYVDTRYWIYDAPYLHIHTSGSSDTMVTRAVPRQELWEYDIATGAWALKYTHGDDEQVVQAWPLTLGGGSYSFAGGAYNVVFANMTHYSPAFAPDGHRIVSFDNRDPASITSSAGTGDLDGFTLWTATTRLATADIALDGEAWLPSVAVSSTATANAFEILDTPGNVRVLQMGAARTGAVKPNTAATAIWLWDADQAPATLTWGDALPRFSKSMRFAFNDSASLTRVYDSGALLYDGATDAGHADFAIHLPSYATDGEFYCTRTTTTTIHHPEVPGSGGTPTIVYGGTVHTTGAGDLPVAEGGGTWFDSVGSILTIDGFGDFTPDEFAVAIGESPGDVTYELDGSSWTQNIGGTSTVPAYDETVTTASAEMGRVRDGAYQTVRVVSSITPAPVDDSIETIPVPPTIANGTFVWARLMPDECVI